MKFASLPKKVAAGGLSLALVAAFTPMAAMASVSDTGAAGVNVPPAQVSGDTVATLTYTKANKNYTQEFKSNKAYTDDDALQAAASQAAILSQDAANTKVTVTLQKDVTVSNAGGTDDKANNAYYYVNTSTPAAYGILVGGKNVTLDLNGKTLSNSQAGTYNTTDAQGNTAETKNNEVTPAVSIGGINTPYETKGGATGTPQEVYYTNSSNVVYPDGTKVQNRYSGDTRADASAAGNKYSWDKTSQSFKNDPDGAYTKGVYTPKVQQGTATLNAASTVTIKGGKVVSANNKAAIENSANSTLTLNGAEVDSTKAKATVDNTTNGKGTVKLQGKAVVNASLDEAADNDNDGKAGQAGDQTSVIAINGGAVNIAKDNANSDPYTSNATVKATLTNGANNHTATAIKGDTVTADNTADVTASAQAGTTSNASQTNSGSGVIDPNQNTANKVASIAVDATTANLNYGNYTADTAVKAVNGTVNYGTYDGYLNSYPTANNIAVNGGKFKYNPKKFYNAQGVASDAASKGTDAAKDLQTQENVKYEVSAQNDGYYYVYRLGNVTGVDYQLYNGNAAGKDTTTGSTTTVTKDAPGKYMEVSYDKTVKDAKGNTYTTLNNYLKDKFLKAETEKTVFSGSDLGKSLNDGNSQAKKFNVKEDQPTLDVAIQALYGTPTAEAAKDGKYTTAYEALAAQATNDGKTAQGLYKVAAQENYGTLKSNSKANKVADVDSLGDAQLKVTAKLVPANSDPTVYTLGSNPVKVDGVTAPAAVGNNYNSTASWNISALNQDQGVLVETTAAQSAAQVKNVNDLIAAIPTGEVNADNQERFVAAIASAQHAYDQLTDAQKKQVANYGLIEQAQKKVDEYQKAKDANAKKQADQAKKDAKAVATAKKAKVKNVKVKGGKKSAKVSWKATKGGYKYQVKYRQKNSSKTAEAKTVKTSKTSKTIKGLKKGQRYNFKVRTYKTVNGKTVYGKWTSIVSAKIK